MARQFINCIYVVLRHAKELTNLYLGGNPNVVNLIALGILSCPRIWIAEVVPSCVPFRAAGAESLACPSKLFGTAATEQGRRHDHETTVDHTLMRGLVTAGPLMRREVSSV